MNKAAYRGGTYMKRICSRQRITYFCCLCVAFIASFTIAMPFGATENEFHRDLYTNYKAWVVSTLGKEFEPESMGTVVKQYVDQDTPFYSDMWKNYVTHINRIESFSICDVEICDVLMDDFFGMIDFHIKADGRYVRPFTCLDPYSPYYQPIESWGNEYCFVETSCIYNDIWLDATVGESPDDIAYEMHAVNELAINIPGFDGSFCVSIKIMYIDRDGNIVEENRTVPIHADKAEPIETKYYQGNIYRNDDVEIFDLKITITPLESLMSYSLNKVSENFNRYDFKCLTPSGKVIKKHGGGQYYIDTMPEYVRMVISLDGEPYDEITINLENDDYPGI